MRRGDLQKTTWFVAINNILQSYLVLTYFLIKKNDI